MGLNFPASPSVGQIFPTTPQNGVPNYKWDGQKWLGTFTGFAITTPAAPTMTWSGVVSDNTPDFSVNLPSGMGDGTDAAVGDWLHLTYSSDGGTTWPDYVKHQLTSTDITTDTISATSMVGSLADGSYLFRARIERTTTVVSAWTSNVSVTINTTVATYVSQAVQFHMTSPGPLINLSLSNFPTSPHAQGTLSVWFNMNDVVGDTASAYMTLFMACTSGGNGKLKLMRTNSDFSLRLDGRDAAGTQVIDFEAYPSGGYTSVSHPGWHHLIASWDLTTATPKGHYYIDRANSGFYIAPGGTSTVDWGSVVNVLIGTTNNGEYAISDLAMGMSDLFLAVGTGTYIDLSISTNLDKFVTSAIKPVDLGATGMTPLGVRPQIYLSGGTTAWATNKGNGGNLRSPASSGSAFPPNAATSP